ncbi:hypothetical protein CIK62_16230 [Brevibacterium aurantiacum]|uniref:FRG domain-containing protein n=2 Tax=Brevibacterium aurantiacum TaxID=273384 RepID=A0A2A3ZBD4_BREAU|nr:hypothetical protein CIK62_16230 [Brevibacterium aurantiacum]
MMTDNDFADGLPEIFETYWRDRAVNGRLGIDDADDIWDFLNQLRIDAPSILSDRTEPIFFRGQSRIDHAFSSSLYRLTKDNLQSGRQVTERHLHLAEVAMMDAARSQGLGRRMSAQQLLCLMQHHLMPTRLIDVSRDPFEALFFALNKDHDTDAVLFMIQPLPVHESWHDSDAGPGSGKDASAASVLPWAGLARGKTQADGSWTNNVILIDIPTLDPRMQAQSGVFLTGGLFRSYRVYYDDKRPGPGYNKGLRHGLSTDLSNLAIMWTKNFNFSQNSGFGATGWVITIPSSLKRELLNRLRKEEGIYSDSMYPPVTEVSRLVKTEAGRLIKREDQEFG